YDRDQRDDVRAMVEGAPGVIVGTLALLGLPPLPDLALVAVTHFDTHLAAADFRSEEEATRTLLRLTELSATRPPLMLVQTYAPENGVLAALSAEDQAAALHAQVEQQLARRKRFGYPPFASLAKLQFS